VGFVHEENRSLINGLFSVSRPCPKERFKLCGIVSSAPQRREHDMRPFPPRAIFAQPQEIPGGIFQDFPDLCVSGVHA
jgi:hypothetical protein